MNPMIVQGKYCLKKKKAVSTFHVIVDNYSNGDMLASVDVSRLVFMHLTHLVLRVDRSRYYLLYITGFVWFFFFLSIYRCVVYVYLTYLGLGDSFGY